jgi:predicted transglutaminase-like cysteine proteinase
MALKNKTLSHLFLFIISLFITFDALAIDKNKTSYDYIDQAVLIRAEQWHALMEGAKFNTDQQKLKQVNDFFNQNITFIADINLWSETDYWATPNEILATGAGDCEDYSIAKYFSLLELGIDAEKLRITYVKTKHTKEAHMVLSYFASPNASPLVLDNLIPEIKPANQRNDLLPIFSFNNKGLWIEKLNGSEQKISHSDQLSKWKDLKMRML